MGYHLLLNVFNLSLQIAESWVVFTKYHRKWQIYVWLYWQCM